MDALSSITLGTLCACVCFVLALGVVWSLWRLATQIWSLVRAPVLVFELERGRLARRALHPLKFSVRQGDTPEGAQRGVQTALYTLERRGAALSATAHLSRRTHQRGLFVLEVLVDLGPGASDFHLRSSGLLVSGSPRLGDPTFDHVFDGNTATNAAHALLSPMLRAALGDMLERPGQLGWHELECTGSTLRLIGHLHVLDHRVDARSVHAATERALRAGAELRQRLERPRDDLLLEQFRTTSQPLAWRARCLEWLLRSDDEAVRRVARGEALESTNLELRMVCLRVASHSVRAERLRATMLFALGRLPRGPERTSIATHFIAQWGLEALSDTRIEVPVRLRLVEGALLHVGEEELRAWVHAHLRRVGAPERQVYLDEAVRLGLSLDPAVLLELWPKVQGGGLMELVELSRRAWVPDYEPHLTRALRYAKVSERRAIVDALGQWGSPHAIAIMEHVARRTPDAQVRRAIRAACEAILARNAHLPRGGLTLSAPDERPGNLTLAQSHGALEAVEHVAFDFSRGITELEDEVSHEVSYLFRSP
ncbi:MAG: hypothetical protein AAGI01_07775 [Myxococcota bacterium]